MVTRTRHATDLQELEALWKLPAKRKPRVTPEAARAATKSIAKWLAIAWPVLLIALIAFEPAPAPQVQVPLWGEIVTNALLLTVLAGIIARFATGPRLPLGLFSAAGAMGIAVGIGCRSSGHHTGSWWAVETALFSALALAAFAGLALTRRT